MRYMTIGFNKKVSLVLLPLDDFTERVIKGSQLRMYTEDGKKPSIRKQEGYHVFCDLEGETVRICAEGPLYQPRTLEFPVGDGARIYQVRMLPAAGYPIPAGSTLVRGNVKPGSRIRLFFPEQKKSYKLLYDYSPKKEGRALSLYCPEEVRLEGKTLCIKGQSGEGEFFRVTERRDERCTLEEPLSGSYKKIGTSVYPVYEVFAGADGSFFLPIRSLPEDNAKCVCLIAEGNGTEEIRRELTLTGGKENLL